MPHLIEGGKYADPVREVPRWQRRETALFLHAGAVYPATGYLGRSIAVISEERNPCR